MAATRSANAVWNGNLTEGAGTTSLATSGLGTFDVTWKARTEAANGKTSPEELIAAAHAACFSMAFSNELDKAGHTPEEVRTKADVTFVPGTGITGSALTVVGKVPDIDAAKFKELAEKAKAECPVSKALGAIKVSLDARLG